MVKKIENTELINQKLREDNESQLNKMMEVGKQNDELREWITKNRLLNQELDEKDGLIAQMAPQIKELEMKLQNSSALNQEFEARVEDLESDNHALKKLFLDDMGDEDLDKSQAIVERL